MGTLQQLGYVLAGTLAASMLLGGTAWLVNNIGDDIERRNKEITDFQRSQDFAQMARSALARRTALQKTTTYDTEKQS